MNKKNLDLMIVDLTAEKSKYKVGKCGDGSSGEPS